jgi:hypothetical protein
MVHGRPDVVVDQYIAAADAGIGQLGSGDAETCIDRPKQVSS